MKPPPGGAASPSRGLRAGDEPASDHPRPASPVGFDEAFLRRLERLAVVVRRDRAARDIGHRRSPAHGASVEFADFRPYAVGDDLRRVDWNAYARFDRLFVRLYHDDQNATLHLLLDVSASMDWGVGETHKVRWAARLVAALGYIALAGLDRVAVAAVAGSVVRRSATFRGTGSARRLFAFLEEQTLSAEPTDLDAALAAHHGRPPGPAVLVSDLLCPGGGLAGLRALRAAGHDVAVVHVLAPTELEPELRGDLRLVDRETGLARDVTADDALLDRYRAALAGWRAELREGCHAQGIAYVPARTDEDLESFVLGALRRGRVVV